MSLDYTSGCVNLRDVGELLELLGGVELLPVGRLIRGGKIDFVTDADQLSCPGTIVNLRKGEDPPTKLFGADLPKLREKLISRGRWAPLPAGIPTIRVMFGRQPRSLEPVTPILPAKGNPTLR